jgi:hypothetical protein
VAGTVAVIEPENLTFFHTAYIPDCTIKAMYQKKALEIFSRFRYVPGFTPHHELRKSVKTYFPSNARDIMSTKYENSPEKIS